MQGTRGMHLQGMMILVGWLLMGFGLLPGCATSTAAPSRMPEPSEDLFPQGFLTVHPGQMDAEDRYLSAVMVVVDSSSQGGTPSGCSGVLVHPRMVITAGHCVCTRRAPTREDAASRAGSQQPRQAGVITRAAALQGISLTDIADARSSCAKTVQVRTVSYASAEEASSLERPERFAGEVVTHPGFEIILGRRSGAPYVVWTNADLAVIFLESPVPLKLPRLELADSEVQVGDLITLVGFSHGTSSPPSYGVRYFGENSVNRLIPLETGSVVFRAEAQQLSDGGAASHAQKGDSGGACIKKGAKNQLVGITTVGGTKPTGEQMSFFTSIYSHRRWLLEMLALAEKS
jgi:hypothetical protein